uniref:Uncharacterized protein n=1 Tax=Setaria digitata TaxID=48799 RepID=A0A915PD49_9BILA
MHSPIQTVMAKLKNSNNGYCEPNSAEAATLFGRACRCAFDWRANFCKQMRRYKSLLAIAEIRQEKSIQQLPIVCICRCACCFNQPDAFCNQLQCRNGEPLFDMHANTTCICHAPTFYPYNICTAYHDALFYDHNEDTVSTNYDEEMEPHYINRPLHEASVHHEESTVMKLYGIQITPTLVITIVLGLLGVIILLTIVLLVVRSCRTHREHRNRAAKRELAQSVLLEQRAEEEKYLP